jgi:hypothetical protein
MKCLSICYGKPQLTQADQFQLCQDMYHGNPSNGTMSQLDLLIMGNEPYAELYDQRSNVAVATDSGSILTTQRVLKQEFLPYNHAAVVAEVNITKSVMENTSFTKPNLVQGRYIHNLATATLRIIKKALAQLEIIPEVEMITPCGEIIYVSGKNEIDANECLLPAMFTELNDKAGVDNGGDEIHNNDEEADNTGNDGPNAPIDNNTSRPIGWHFNGWLASCCSVPLRQRASDYRLCVHRNM